MKQSKHKKPQKKITQKDAEKNELKQFKIKVNVELFRYVFCILGALLTYLIVAYAVVKLYHPDIQSIIDEAKQISALTDFQPEPVEAMLYRVGLLVVPIALLFFYWISLKLFFQKCSQRKGLVYTLGIAASLGIAFLAYYVFAQPNPTAVELVGTTYNNHDMVATTNQLFFFKDLILHENIGLYSLVVVPLLLLFYIFLVKKMKPKGLKYYHWIVSLPGYILTAFLIWSVMMINYFELPINWQNQYDFNAVYYSVTQVNAGSQLLVDNFANTYGLYPHFLQPIFNIIGLSVPHFTLIMSLLIGFCFAAMFIFMRVFTKDRLFVFLGFASLLVMPYLQIRFVTDPDSVFAMFPIRMLPPSLLFLMVTLWITVQKSKHKIATYIVYYLGMILMAVGILWNFEFGMVSFVAWLLFLSYFHFQDEQNHIQWKKIILHWVIGLLSVAFVFGLYALLSYIQYGHYPDYKLMFSALMVFSHYGFNLLPMPLWSPWMLVILTYVLGLIYAISSLFRGQITPKSAVIFVASILGSGLWAYYQGRSHNINMFPSILFAFIVLVLLVDELWASYQKSSAKILIPFLYIALYALFFSTIDVVANASKIKDLSDKIPQSKELRISANQETTKIQRIRSFIDSCNVTTPKVFVFCSNRYQGLYMESSKMRSALNPGFLDLFYKSDLQRYVQTVIDSSFNIFMDVQGFYYPNCENIRAAVSQHYYSEKELRDTTSVTVAFLKKRKVEMPKTSFFKEDQTQIYYEKYRDDSLGNQRRIALAGQGIDSLVFPDEFSYEVLVYPDAHQICRGAAIIGNATDSSGFCICKSTIKTDSQAYIILRGNQAVSINLTPNTWHYIVVGISGERMVVIDNNTLVARVIFPRAYQNKTSTNLFIGNLTTRRNFNGLISEVSIKKGLIVEEEIHKTWERIQQNLKK